MFAALGALVIGSIASIGSAVALKSTKRTVTPGIFRVADFGGCAEGDFCLYENDVTAYGRPLFEPIGDLTPAEAFLGVTFLGPNDAVVVITNVPDALYWSFIPYVWEKGVKAEGYGPVLQSDGSYSYVLFSSISSGVNNFSFPSASRVAIIMTRNVQVYEAERSAILGVMPNVVVAPVWIPREVSYDSPISLVLRGSYFPDGGYKYYLEHRDSLAYKATWYNIGMTDIVLVLPNEPKPDIPPGSFPFYIKPQPKNPSEFPLTETYDRYVRETLSKYTIIRELRVAPFLKDTTGKPITSDWDCYKNNIMCLVDNPDTAYLLTEGFSLEEGKTSLVVCAINHRVTQRAFYSNINFYDLKTEASSNVASPRSDQLFYNQDWSPGNGDFRIVERAYVQLPYNTAPSADTLLFMRVFIVKWVPNPKPFEQVDLDLLNPNTEILKMTRILMTGE